ncbi:MAG: hypothetical protein EU541_00095 [Promethearchaeota archaeon]|nr:MAG: hypothetical protein EU541_00095 [Candidatus Lokiarchaeota archaeon]
MTKKKYLSTKKTSRQTISISPALKDWVKRYLNKMNSENPEDERYKSISAFYTYVMEKAMNAFEKGKTLDDFEHFVDGEIYEFYDEYSFKAHRPMVEMSVRPHKYTNLDLNFITHFFNDFVLILKKTFSSKNVKKLQKFLDRISSYLNSNKIADYIKIEVLNLEEFKKTKKDLTVMIETRCPYEHICYENNKLYAALFAIAGMKVINFTYSKKNSYYRWEAIATDQLLKEELLEEETTKLFNHNISFLTNYKRVLDDEHFYLWMKLAKDKGVWIDFDNKFTRERWIKAIEDDIKKFSAREDIGTYILKFFETLHWIDIEHEDNRIFTFRLPKAGNNENKESLLKYLAKVSTINQIDGKYQLK